MSQSTLLDHCAHSLMLAVPPVAGGAYCCSSSSVAVNTGLILGGIFFGVQVKDKQQVMKVLHVRLHPICFSPLSLLSSFPSSPLLIPSTPLLSLLHSLPLLFSPLLTPPLLISSSLLFIPSSPLLGLSTLLLTSSSPFLPLLPSPLSSPPGFAV